MAKVGQEPQGAQVGPEAPSADPEEGGNGNITRRRRLDPRRVTEGAPFFPLFVLFGLNAVDELDRAAFEILLPEIRDAFGLSSGSALGLVALVSPVALLVGLPVAFYADRLRRTAFATGGGLVWGGFSFLTGIAPGVPVLAVARAGSGIGKSVNWPTHNSLLSDYYPVSIRAKLYAFYQSANHVGKTLGPVVAGILAVAFSWRAPFIAFTFVTAVFVLLSLRLREPTRGIMDRRAAGADEATAAVEENPPTFGEAWRLIHSIATLRRLYFALPLLAGSVIGLQSVLALFYEEVYGVGEIGRGVLFAVEEPFNIVGLVIGAPIAQRLMRDDPGRTLRFLGLISIGVAGFIVLIAASPNLPVAVGAGWLRALISSLVAPTLLAIFSVIIPPKARSLGFAAFAVWALPGLLVLPIVGAIGDTHGFRWALLLIAPMYLLGAFVMSTAAPSVSRDIENTRRYSTMESAARRERERFLAMVETGEVDLADFPLLEIRDVQFSYGNVQVLFDVDLQIPRGGRVALLGTNGAGKSTLLKVISGIYLPDVGTGGTVWYEQDDITFTTAEERVRRGIIQVGGGRATFPTLSVRENLQMGAFLFLHDEDLVAERITEVTHIFPTLSQRMGQPAGTLSGGEQQMLALARAFIGRPKLLIIDELSLGLAPVVMQEILTIVDEFARRETTMLIVEQSLNVAMKVADQAYFMEKGEVRFSGPIGDLLDRGDLARSVFLGADGARSAASGNGSDRR